jgi:hypothetical protein
MTTAYAWYWRVKKGKVIATVYASYWQIKRGEGHSDKKFTPGNGDIKWGRVMATAYAR